MSLYLRLKDYYAFIQSDNLQQVIRADDSLRVQAELGAEAKITEYLVQKYDLTEEFMDTLVYSPSKTYKATQLVDLNFTPYSATSTYAVNDTVLESGKSYICTTAITVAEPFTVGKWKLLGNQYDLFYIPTPYPLFDYQANYVIGDKIYWKGKVYVCKQNSVTLNQNAQLQYSTYDNLPNNNSFPDKDSGFNQWGTGVDYSLSGLLPTAVPGDYTAWSSVTTYTVGDRVSFDSQIFQAIVNSTDVSPDSDITKWQPVSWSAGDNRNPSIVERYVDITLYKLHKGIAPRNIPDLRVKAYDDAINDLDKWADGRITLALPKLQPFHGNKIRFGGNIKNNNSY